MARKKKTGRLSKNEMIDIQNYILDGKTDEEITELLGRNCIDPIKSYRTKFEEMTTGSKTKELEEKIKELEARLEKTSLVEEEPTTKGTVKLLDETIQSTIYKLKTHNIKEEDAKAALRVIQSKLTERIDNPDRLVALCLQQLNAYRAMVTSTSSGNKGVAAMTGAASSIIEEKKRSQPRQQSSRECLVSSKTGEEL